jgi:HPt (histidine-containing phosphotransfer) domain-containing protein
MQGDRERCLGAGMTYYLDKPIVVDELKNVLELIANELITDTPTSFATNSRQRTSVNTNNRPRATPSTPESPLDFTAPVKRLRCSQEQLKVLLKTLYHEVEQRINELSDGFENSDIETVTRAAHSLRSASQLFNANNVSLASTLIEEASRQGDLQSAVTHFERLCHAASEARHAIDEWFLNNQ